MADESTNALIAGIYASVKDVATNSKQTLAAQAEEQRKAFDVAAATIRKEVGESLARREQTQHRLIVEACGDIAALLRSNLHVLRSWRDMALEAAPVYNAAQARIARWWVSLYYLVAASVTFSIGWLTWVLLPWVWRHAPQHRGLAQALLMGMVLVGSALCLRWLTALWFGSLVGVAAERPIARTEKAR